MIWCGFCLVSLRERQLHVVNLCYVNGNFWGKKCKISRTLYIENYGKEGIRLDKLKTNAKY